jgi:hypothetical protein
MNYELTEFQTYDGEILGRLYMDPDEKIWIFMDLDEEYPERHNVKFFTHFEDEILITCHNDVAFRF